MVVTVCVRPYRFGDDLQIQSVVTEGTMITVMPFFWQAATREMTAQVNDYDYKSKGFFSLSNVCGRETCSIVR